MKITEVKIFKIDRNTLKGFASVTFDSCFVVKNFKIMHGTNGLFINMPSEKAQDGYKDTAFPITKEFREQLQKAILDKYNVEDDGFYPADEQDESSLPF
jgi:stage V sporulation protein G